MQEQFDTVIKIRIKVKPFGIKWKENQQTTTTTLVITNRIWDYTVHTYRFDKKRKKERKKVLAAIGILPAKFYNEIWINLAFVSEFPSPLERMEYGRVQQQRREKKSEIIVHWINKEQEHREIHYYIFPFFFFFLCDQKRAKAIITPNTEWSVSETTILKLILVLHSPCACACVCVYVFSLFFLIWHSPFLY